MKDMDLKGLSDQKIKRGLRAYNEAYKYMLQNHIDAGWSFWSFVGRVKDKHPNVKLSMNDVRVWCKYIPEINEIRNEYLRRIGKA